MSIPKQAFWFSAVAVAIAVVVAASAPWAGGRNNDTLVPYPEGYRNWTHVKSMVILKGHPLEQPFAGIHHVYGNEKAIDGLQTGKYRKGAAFAFDLLTAQQGEHDISEGQRKLLGVMLYDPDRYSQTGGWGFEGFAGDSKTERLVTDGGTSCFACHQSARATNYVFSRWRP